MPSLDKRPIPAAERTVVVATALLADGRLLAAERRTRPAEGMRPGRQGGGPHGGPDGGPPIGLWELPGGKVEAGEDEAAAVVRECAEELALAVRPVERLGGAWPVGERFLLRVWLAVPEQGLPELGLPELGLPRLGLPEAGLPQPQLRVHRRHRWLTLDEVADLAWLPSNRPLVRAVVRRLRSSSGAPGAPAEGGMTERAASVDHSSGFELI